MTLLEYIGRVPVFAIPKKRVLGSDSELEPYNSNSDINIGDIKISPKLNLDDLKKLSIASRTIINNIDRYKELLSKSDGCDVVTSKNNKCILLGIV